MDRDAVYEKTINSFSPLSFAGKIIGLFPFNIVNGKMKFGLFSTSYTIFIFIFSAYNLFYQSIYYDLVASETPKYISAKVYLFYKTSQAIILFSCFPPLLLNYKANNARLDRLLETTYRLATIGVLFNNERLRKYLRDLNAKVYAGWSAVFAVDYCVLFVWGDMGRQLSVSSWAIGDVVIVYNSLVLFYTFGIVAYLAEFVTLIAHGLERTVAGETGRATLRERIAILIDAHDELVFVSESFVAQNSLVLLLTVVMSIVGTTGHLYNIFTIIFNLSADAGSRADYFLLVYSTYWCFILLFKITKLISESVRLMKQANRAAIIVHDLLSSDETVRITSEMIGAISTFLVILVQFKIENRDL